MPLDGIPAVSSMNAESSSSSSLSSSLSSSCSLVGVEKIVWSELRTAIMNGFASGSGLWFDETHEDAEVKITELLTEIREISAKEGLSRLSCEAWREEEDCLIAITVHHPMGSAVHRLQPAPLSLISSELLWWDQLDVVSLAPPHLRRVGQSSSELLQSFGWQELVAHELDALVVADVMQYLESPSDSQALNTLPFFLREYMRNHPDDCFAGICGLVDLFLSSKQLDWWTYRLRKAGLQVVLLTESCPGSSRSLNDLTWLQAASKRPVPVEEVPQQSALSSSSTTVRKVEVLRGYQLLMEEIASAASACAREEIQRRFLPSTPDLDITKVDEICKILLLSGKVLTVAYFLANLQLITPLFVFCQRLAASANFLALAPTKMTSHPSLFTGKDTDLDYYHSASSDYYNHGRGREMRGWDLLHRPPLPSDRVQSLSFDQSQPIKTAPTESNSLNRKRMEQAIIVFLLTVEKLILFGDWSEGNDSTVLDMLKEIVHYRPWGVTLQQTLGTLSVCKGQDKEQKLTSLISTMFT